MFRSYLTDRKLFVEIDGTRSSYYNVNYRTPQGSVLGPII